MDTTTSEVIEYLEEQLKGMKQQNEPMNESSWDLQEGMLLTGNQAKCILEEIKKIRKDK